MAAVNRSTAQQSLPMTDDNFLRMPVVGDHSLRLLNSNVVEVMMVTAKDPDPAPLTSWNFLSATGVGSLPPASSFTVSANGQSIPVTGVGFKRRVLYAPLRVRDLRIANWLYLQLGAPIPADAVVSVQNVGAALWSSSVLFTATNSAQRYTPAIHVNQAGYVSNFPKKALVGFYLGTMGELQIPSGAGFQVVSAATGATVFSGTLSRHPDVGYSYTPTPYQQVFEADFTSFNIPGEYKIFVPGMGVSFPFFIDEGMAATYARTYALGIYHQRCGTDNVMPYTRHTHGPCHTNLVLIPSFAGPEKDFTSQICNQESTSASSNPRHTAPRMTNVDACLYPYVNTGLIDARGGHHDAGDYSKYTTSVSAFIHYLTFAVDSLPGVKDLDNLGIPESGDGISDIIQEAKWEADYLAKLQDADGGFYFIVYPRTRQYELDVTPDHGDTQLVLPKNTAATAAAVGALADIASSPTFKAAYPVAASNYLAKAIKGWQFLQTAIARYGKDGAYQMITFSGDTFMHDDELAWAAAALYAATGDAQYNTALRSYMPNPNSPSLRRWDWWSMFGGWGCATRDYGFAVRSGRLTSAQIDPAYLALCEAEIKFAGSNSVDWSAKMAYGSSFTDESKGLRVAGWYFSGEWTLDPAAAWVIDPSTTTKALYIDCILKNYNYEMGCNPVNVTYLTGLGWKRQREIVHQYALNDYRVLPPGGIPLGNIQAQYDYLQLYKTELSSVSYPLDDSPGQPYAYYDRWADTFNVSTEFVVSQTAKTLPAAAMLMAMTPTKTQVWNSATAKVVNLPISSPASQSVTPSLSSSLDLSKARIVWEAREQEPYMGSNYTFTPVHAGVQWVEAEAQLPDGRRVVVLTNFTAILQATNTIEQYQTIPLAGSTNVVAWYKLDSNLGDAAAHEASLTANGNAFIDNGSFSWPNRPGGAALRVLDLGDNVTVSIPNAHLSSATSDAVSIEAMFYVNKQVAYGRGNADLFVLSKTWSAELAMRHNIWTDGPAVTGGSTSLANNVQLAQYLKTGQWQHLKIRLSRAGYTLSIDGQVVASAASTDLGNWGGGGNASFVVGNFDGWVDEIVIKNEGGGSVSNPPPTGSALVSIAATGNANEGTLGAGGFQITRDSTAATNLTVNLTVGGTATIGVDYTALPTSVVIPAGSTSATLTVTPLADTNYEGNETVIATLTASAAYTIGTATATVSIIDDDPDNRPPPPGRTNYVTVPTVVDTNVLALYHFDGNLAEAAGRYSALTLGGAAALDNSNLNWMSSPSGSALRVQNQGDKVTATLNNINLYTSGTTASLGIEAFIFVKKFTGYTSQSSTLFKLSKRWDAQMIYNRDTWQLSPELWGGINKMIDVPALAPYIQTNCWQKIGVFLDETGYFVKVNDVEVARGASTDISKWAGAGNVDIELGSFDGWIDELAVRSNVKGFVPSNKTNQTVSFGPLTTKTYGDAAFTVSATASSGLPVTFSSGDTSVATISGNTITIVGAGSVAITATQAGNTNYNPMSVAQTLTVNKATATVTLGNLNVTYDGSPKPVSVTTTPASLAVNVTYNGSSTVPTAVGSYPVVATVNNANYSGTANGTLIINQLSNQPQTVSFAALPTKTFGNPAFTISATASSGLPVTFSSGNTSVATISGNTVTIVGAGTAVITASQAGNATYNPAATAQTLTVNKAAATVTLSGLNTTYNGSAKTATVTTTPAGLSVNVTYAGSSTAPVNAGSYAVVATVNNNNYTGSASGTLVIAVASQTISFGALAATTYGNGPFSLTATASSGLPVTFSSGNTSVATVSGNTVTIIGAGSAVITASQSGGGNYAAASSVPQTLVVNKAAATVALGALNFTYDGAPKPVSVTTTPAGLTTSVTYNGSTTAPTVVGSYTVVATVNNANYAGSASGTLLIAQLTNQTQTVTFAPLLAKTFGDAPMTLSATASSGLAVTFSSGNTAVATVSGNTLTIVGAGTAVITASQNGNVTYNPAIATQTLTVNKATATVTLSGLSTTYTGSGKNATATTAPAGLPVTITYDGGSALPVNAGSYSVTATVNHNNYSGVANGTMTISLASQTITFGALAAKTFGNPSFALSATASSGLPVSYVSGNPSVAVVSGNTVTIVGAGSAVLTASQSGSDNYAAAPNVSQTLVVNKGAATVSLGGLTVTYDGSAKPVSVTTSPIGLPVNVTYNGSSTAPSAAGSYPVAATVTDVNYTGSANGTLTILQPTNQPQSVTFASLPVKTYGDASFTVSATASSGLPVTFSSGNTAVATVLGNVVTIVGAGSAVITANQAGDTTYNPAAASQTLTVNKAAATVNLSALNVTYDGDSHEAVVSTTPGGLPVTVTYNGGSTLPENAGSYAVVATINHNNYSGTASGTLTISQSSQTISFASLAAKSYGDVPFTLSAMASSGLPVTYVSANPSVATVSGSMVTILSSGSTVITASQSGNGNYTAAANVAQTLVVNKATASVTLSGLNPTYNGSQKVVTATTTPAGLPITITYNGGATVPSNAGSYAIVATVTHSNYTGSANATLTINKAPATVTLSGLNATYDGSAKPVGATTAPTGLSVNVTYNGSSTVPSSVGSYSVLATISDANYAGSASGNLLITQPAAQSQTISFGALPAKTYGDASFTLSATASSGLPVTFSSGNTAVATVSGNTVTIVGAGSALITAIQSGDSSYNPAAASQTLIVGKATATVAVSGLNAAYDGAAKTASAITTPPGLAVTITYNGGATLPVNVGSYTVVATINNNNYSGSGSGTLNISQGTQTISFSPLPAKAFGEAPFNLNATASSGLPVSYISGNPSVATISGNTLTIVGMGTAVITASQAGNSNYLAAANVAQSLVIGKTAATITLSGLNPTYTGTPKAVTATTSPSGLATVITYNGSGIVPSSAGSYAVVAMVINNNYVGSANATLTINKAAATVNLSGLSATYDGTVKPVTVSTVPAGLAVSITYNGSTTVPSAVGSYPVVATITDVNYAGTANGTLLITQPAAQSQTVSFGILPTKAYGDSSFTVNATASSGLPVIFSSANPAVATVSGNTVTIVGAGTTVITANQGGNATYNPAAATQTLTVNKGTASVILSGLSVVYDGNVHAATASTAPAGLSVAMTYNGSANLPSAAGNYAVVATINDDNYVGGTSGTFTITPGGQTISFGPLAPKTFGDAAFSVNATTSSGLPVTFSSANPNVATVSGSTVTIVGVGSAVIVASQPGDGTYYAAAPVTQTLVVNKATATVILSGLNASYDGIPKGVTASTSPSGLPVNITYNGNSSPPVNVGDYTVVATVEHNNYVGTASGTLSISYPGNGVMLTVFKEGQGTVTPDLTGQNLTQGTNVTLTATADTGWMFGGWIMDGAVVSTNRSLPLTVNSFMIITASFLDATAPVVSITGMVTNTGRASGPPTLTLTGTASDNAGVQSVEYAIVGPGAPGDFQTAYGTTNWTIDLQPVYGTNTIRVRARDFKGNISTEATRKFVYIEKSQFSLTIFGPGTVTPNLNGQMLELGKTYTLKATANSGCKLDRWEGGIQSSNASLSFIMTENLSLTAFFRETIKPLVTITAPAANSRLMNGYVVFYGTASDQSGIDRVEWSLNDSDYLQTGGTLSWNATVLLKAGTNIFRVRSVDGAGNVSTVVSRSVTHVVMSPLNLSLNGIGSVSGATNGQLLEVGRAYKLTATPGAGQMFAEWTGDISWPSNTLTMVMKTNLALQANFVTNPYAPLKGTYQALFYETNQVRHDRSGSVKLTLAPAGTFSASVKLGTKTLSASGAFDWLGRARMNLTLSPGNVVAVTMQLDVTNATDVLTGVASNASWVAPVNGFRAPTFSTNNPPPMVGRYTFFVPADDSSTNNPEGLGYGTMTVSSAGLGTLSGKLGDGTTFTVAATVSQNGAFPLYAQLYANAGSTLGWLSFANLPLSDFNGAISWIKPVTASTTAYPKGFAVNSYCMGSTYSTNVSIFDLSNAPMEFNGGSLGAGFVNLVNALPTGTVQNLSSNKLTFTLTKSTGLFTGTVINPVGQTSLPYSGAVFQKGNAALGQLTSNKKTSAVKLSTPE